jgi:hypothetical protein
MTWIPMTTVSANPSLLSDSRVFIKEFYRKTLYGLIERLDEKWPGLAIVKSGRGRFDLDVTCKIEFEG